MELRKQGRYDLRGGKKNQVEKKMDLTHFYYNLGLCNKCHYILFYLFLNDRKLLVSHVDLLVS